MAKFSAGSKHIPVEFFIKMTKFILLLIGIANARTLEDHLIEIFVKISNMTVKNLTLSDFGCEYFVFNGSRCVC